jgi:hypothetical protein
MNFEFWLDMYFYSNTQFGDMAEYVDMFVGIKFWQESFCTSLFLPPL